MVAWVAAVVLAGAPVWKQVAAGDVQVFTREVPGGRTAELKAVTELDATPAELRAVLEDEEYSRKSSSHIEELRTVSHPDPRTWIRYGRLSFPFFEDRDYFIEVKVDQDLGPDGRGPYRSSWKPWGLDRPTRSNVVRLTRNEGHWQVDPLENGRSRVEYFVSCDPGGSLPGWAVDMVQKRMIPDYLRDLQREVLRRRAAGGQAHAP